MKPQALTNDEFKKFVEEFKRASRIELVSSGIRTASTREIAGGDNDKREEQLDNVNKNLEAINATLVTLTKKFTGTIEKTSQKISDKLAQIEKVGTFSPVSKIKDDRPTTFREQLKSGVAGVKRLGSNISESFSGFKDRMQQVRTPSGDLKAAGGFITRVGESAKDILDTPKEYTPEGERFAEILSKRTGEDKVSGIKQFADLTKKEKDISAIQKTIDLEKAYGFEPRKEDVEKLQTAKKEFIAADPRQRQTSIQQPSVLQNDSQKEMVTETKKQTEQSKDLLKATNDSLDELKNISKSLGVISTTPQQQPQQQTGGGSGGGSDGGSGGRGIGSRILGGLGTAAKAVGGALMAKPALAVGGALLAGGALAYGAYKGYKAIKGAFSGGDEKTTTETTVTAKDEMKFSEAKFAENDPESHKEYQKFISDELDKGMKQIDADFKSGKKKGAREVFEDQLQRDVEERAKDKFKDKMIAAGAILEVKEGKTLKGKPLDQVPSSQQAPVAQKAGFGDKVGSFFGGIKDSVVGAAGKVGAAVGTAGAAVGSFASGLKDKVIDTAQYVSEEYDRDISATADEEKLNVEADKRIKEAGVDPFSQEANNIREQVREEMFAADPNAFMTSEQKVGTKQSFKEDSVSAGKKYYLEKDKMESGITAQKSLFGSSFLGSMFSKEGQRTSQFLSRSSDQEVLLANAAELGLGSDLPVEYKKRTSNTLLGERISSGSIFKRDKYNVSNTTTGQDLNVTKDEYNKLQALVAEGKAEEAQKLFDEINAREAAYVPEEGITPEEQMVAPSKGASNLATVRDTTVENAAMREEMAATQDVKPVVVNTTNAVNSNTQTFTPMRTTPRHNNNSFERKQNETAYYGT